jgi:hypothetical protein
MFCRRFFVILPASREREVFDRASHRSVTALVNMEIPGQDPHVNPENYGVIIHSQKALQASRILDQALDAAFARSATCWNFEDTCEPLVQRDPAVLQRTMSLIARRMKALSEAGAVNLSRDDKKALFDSADVIDEATGIKPKLTYDFNGSVLAESQISQIPFPKLKEFVLRLLEKLTKMDGSIQSVTISHTTAMSAFEYYEMALNPHIQGKRFSYGEVMLIKAQNLLAEVGMPLVYPKKPAAGFH